MALEKAFRDLVTCLGKARDAFHEVRLTVVEDRPRKSEVIIVDHFEYGIEDILGWLEEAFNHGSAAEKAVALPLNLDRAVRSLTKCQALFQNVQRRYSADLVSYAKIEELIRVGRERKGEWKGWTDSVLKGLEQCRESVDQSGLALTSCWQEIAERPAGTNVTVQATNIGQQIVRAPAEIAESVEERVP